MTTEEHDNSQEKIVYPEFYVARGPLDPAYAKELYNGQELNINISKRVVSKYADAMTRGEWDIEACEPIRINRYGRMNDGQHRCLAVIESGVTIESMFYFGVSDRVQLNVNTGKSRSFAGFLKLKRVQNNSQVSALVRLLWNLESDVWGSHQNWNVTTVPTLPLLWDYYQTLDAELVRRSLLVSASLRSSAVGINQSGFAAFFVNTSKLGYEGLEADLDEFTAGVRTGADLPQGSPILALRRAVDLGNPSRPREAWHHYALAVKGWNYWRAGKTVTYLRFKPYGNSAEEMPVPK